MPSGYEPPREPFLKNMLFGSPNRAEREEKVLRYVIHRTNEETSLHDVIREDYVRRNCSQDESVSSRVPASSRVSKRPILITGSHRSGSTWLATMLALSENSLLAHEPFNIEQPWAYALNGLAKYWFTYAPALHHDQALQLKGYE